MLLNILKHKTIAFCHSDTWSIGLYLQASLDPTNEA